jgi:hypothetical protein
MSESERIKRNTEIVEADRERQAQAGWLALGECAPYPDDLADWHSVNRWRKSVNKKAEEIFGRLI